MRDINRIENICNRLCDMWKKVPDMRLTQLICNLQCYKGNDLFYIEDEEFIRILNEYVSKIEVN